MLFRSRILCRGDPQYCRGAHGVDRAQADANQGDGQGLIAIFAAFVFFVWRRRCEHRGGAGIVRVEGVPRDGRGTDLILLPRS